MDNSRQTNAHVSGRIVGDSYGGWLPAKLRTGGALSARSIRPALADRWDGDYTLRWVVADERRSCQHHEYGLLPGQLRPQDT